MSSRQLRKLQKQGELEKLHTESEEYKSENESDVDDAPAPLAAKPRASLFAALGGEEEEEEEEEMQDQTVETGRVGEGDEAESSAAPPSKKKSKKNKKKKKKAKTAAQDEVKSGAAKDVEEDEIDKALKELKLSTRQGGDGVATGGATASATLRINQLLGINTYRLKAMNEMRHLFGRDVIESAHAEEEQQQIENNRRRRGPTQQQVDLETFLRGPPGAKRLPEVSLRRNVFIQGREHWPRQTAGGLGMKQVGKSEDGSSTEYAYVHDKEYDAVQTFFFSCVQMGDPMRIVYLLQQVPYHVSTLLQVSSVAKQDQNMALSAELCERALFTFGRVATSAFRQDLENGRARLDFRRPENRQLWLAGYHYLRSLIRKGTYRTALEWAKLLFALDHADPYATRHFIHFLAIRAYEAEWLVSFLDELEKTSDNRDTIYLRQTGVLAKLQLKDIEGARAELEQGIRRLPWLYCALYQELGIDAPPSIWGINAESDRRSFWVKLYIYQTKDLWNNTAATSLLQEVAKSLDRVDISSLPVDDSPPDLGVTRLAYLEGQTSIIALAPRDLLDSQPNYEFDPLPPREEDNIFTGEGCRMPWKDMNAGSRAMEHQIEAQLRNLMERRQARAQAVGAGAGAAGGMGIAGIPGDDDFENPELDALDLNDPELQRDLEEHAARANAPGLVQTLMRMFRGEPAPDDDEGVDNEQEVFEGYYSDDDDVPGAWPEDER
ncbi:Pfam:DUF654 [Geosmithia morbida]|uniref:Pfam:DUF654 n=1 Tax=Geosmithia morbida TaxID=1094350 RepID=A0A9P4Z1A6_9HYPO|nr:Pfam:DUF654 [Geosmithia morbida]KAF4125860.1 Pfam:DUF654 [Geosmithia morbida]